MKPDAYMPFYGNDFFQAIRGYPAFIKIAYLSAIWYYWTHNHCAGLRDNSEFLRDICGADTSEWDFVKPVVFDNRDFFCLDASGVWHQKRTFEIWQKSVEQYNKAVNRARKGAEGRWK